MKYYSAIKRNEILPFVTIWMNLEGIMLRKILSAINQTAHRYREHIGGCQRWEVKGGQSG